MGKSRLHLKQIPDLTDFLEKIYKEIDLVKKFFGESGLKRAELLKEDVKKFTQEIGKEKRILAEFIAEKNKLQKSKDILDEIERVILPKACKYKKDISQSQIRKHYNYFLDIYQDIEHKNWKLDEEHFVKLAMEKVYINYDFARDNVNYLFKRFVEDLIDKVEDEKTLKDAQVLFEALVGYSKVFIKN